MWSRSVSRAHRHHLASRRVEIGGIVQSCDLILKSRLEEEGYGPQRGLDTNCADADATDCSGAPLPCLAG